MKISLLAGASLNAVLASTVAVTLLSTPFAAIAQDDSDVLEEIVVTARKKEESLQSVPISVSALSATQIDNFGIVDTRDVARFVPNVTMDNFAGRTNNTFIFIRGVGGGDGNAAGLQAGVGIYEDGVYMPRAQGGYLSILDIERIEVLRGPQGTLFGKNTTGGAVNIISAKPGPELSSNWTLRAGNYRRIDLRGSVNVPLIEDKLFARISAASERRRGFYTETNTGEHYGDRNRVSGRIAFRYLPNEHWTLDLSGTFSSQPERTPGATCVWDSFTGLQGAIQGTQGVNFQSVCDASNREQRTFSSDQDGFSNTQVWGVNSQTTWDSLGSALFFDNLQIKLLAAIRGQDQSFLEDSDWTEAYYESRSRVTPTLQDQRTVELQFIGDAMDSRMHLVTGVYWADDEAVEGGNDCLDEYDTFLATGMDVPCVAPGGFNFDLVPTAGVLSLSSQVTAKIETYAIYANASFDLTDRLNLTVGARQTWEDRDAIRFDIVNLDKTGNAVIATINDANVAKLVVGSQSWNELTPTASLSYDLSPFGAVESGNLYFTYAKGFQSGGFNTEFSEAVLGDLFFYQPETVNSYELGLKMDIFDGRARLNISAYTADFKDRQVENNIENVGQFGPTITDPALTLITNAATMSTDGFELELAALPVDNMLVNLAVGYLDAKYDDYVGFDPDTGQPIDLSNQNVDTLIPEWSATGIMEYTFDLPSGNTLTPRIIGYYRDGYEFESGRNRGDPKSAIYQDAYTKWDARLSWRSQSGATTVTLFGQNIFDKDTLRNGTDIVSNRGYTRILLDAPAVYGVEFQLEF